MKEEGKICYVAPAITVVELKMIGVVCQSPGITGLDDIIGTPYIEE